MACWGSSDGVLCYRGRASAPFWYRSPYDDTQGRPLLTVQRIGASFFFCYSEGTHVLVNDAGSEIDAWWDPPLTAADAADYLLGGILAFVVRRRGMLPLHASAVVLDVGAVCGCGRRGQIVHGRGIRGARCSRALGRRRDDGCEERWRRRTFEPSTRQHLVGLGGRLVRGENAAGT